MSKPSVVRLRGADEEEENGQFFFQKATGFCNADECGSTDHKITGVYDPSLVHVAITPDVDYLRRYNIQSHSESRQTNPRTLITKKKKTVALDLVDSMLMDGMSEVEIGNKIVGFSTQNHNSH
ncbi:hypothetical protein V6N13_041301 [Hibiscus sabdariffa]|uniref:Uncharacterized protein n=1 Tax=Hibiscus sabdariffa TaxID=183260 RepID=A0ABR2RBQ2_9ROSI